MWFMNKQTVFSVRSILLMTSVLAFLVWGYGTANRAAATIVSRNY